MEIKYDWPNCIGMGDGTLFPLVHCPSTDDAPGYSGRKYTYILTLSMMTVGALELTSQGDQDLYTTTVCFVVCE